MPAGRAAAFGAAATVVGAYALQDHLRSRAAPNAAARPAGIVVVHSAFLVENSWALLLRLCERQSVCAALCAVRTDGFHSAARFDLLG